MSGSADGAGPYFCGWAITGRSTLAHLVASARFPLAGRQYRTWCGQIVTVVALTLNARSLPQSCELCNEHLRLLARAPRVRGQGSVRRLHGDAE